MEDCIFCKIINKEIPSNIVYEDENVLSIANNTNKIVSKLSFKDINPQAPIHLIVIPKRHMTSVLEADSKTVGDIFEAINKIAKQEKIDKDGFRVITNCGKGAGQTVNHLHFHILAGAKLDEKMC